MSGEQRRSGAPQGPPWALDLLADLHAEALDADMARELFPLVRQDPAAAEILAGLDATRRDMAELPPLRMPDEVADRICTALSVEAAAPPAAGAPVVELGPARRRRRRVGWGIGALVAAAAVLAVVIVSPMLLRTTHEATTVPASPPPMALSGGHVHLDRAQLTEALHSHQYVSALSDTRTLQGCLHANGVTGQPLGARSVTLNGQTAQMLILPTGAIGRFRVLVVGLDCGPGNPATMSDNTFGG